MTAKDLRHFPLDADISVADWLAENLRLGHGKAAARLQMEGLSKVVPLMVLERPATPLNCYNISLTIHLMAEHNTEEKWPDVPDLDEMDMNEYEGADTVGEIVERYLKSHAPEKIAVVLATNISEIFGTRGGLFEFCWDEEPSELDRRRWVLMLRRTLPPRLIRDQAEIARLKTFFPGRN